MRTLLSVLALCLGLVGESAAQPRPRVVYALPGAVPGTGVVPSGYVRVMGEGRLRGAMRAGAWWLPASLHRPVPGSARVDPCARWDLEALGENWVLRHRRVFRRGTGLVETRHTATFSGNPTNMLQQENGSEEWLRPVRDGVGGRSAWGSGSHVRYALVAATPGRLVWVEAVGVAAYHPADAIVWFRSRAACLAAQPRRA